ncbi:MAG: hypothetical protein ACTS2F_28715 [Thainema sp.]
MTTSSLVLLKRTAVKLKLSKADHQSSSSPLENSPEHSLQSHRLNQTQALRDLRQTYYLERRSFL